MLPRATLLFVIAGFGVCREFLDFEKNIEFCSSFMDHSFNLVVSFISNPVFWSWARTKLNYIAAFCLTFARNYCGALWKCDAAGPKQWNINEACVQLIIPVTCAIVFPKTSGAAHGHLPETTPGTHCTISSHFAQGQMSATITNHRCRYKLLAMSCEWCKISPRSWEKLKFGKSRLWRKHWS